MSATESKTIKVLLVDDHNLLRESLTDSLSRLEDFEVVGQAADGSEVLAVARQTRPDVVIMDVSMPQMSGLHATQRLRLEMPQVRVVGLSMHTSQEMARAMRSAGAAAYLTKETSISTLVDVLRSVVDDRESDV